ncbi:MAG: hypothetical protein ACXAB7_05795 [Candidatus Kariarchaeaceae archaeon]|jgi:hypothetical protein
MNHVLNIEVVELRYSLNGISDSQLRVLFSHIERERHQIILRRLTNPRYALSSDDIILEGVFSAEFLSSVSRAFPPPLACKLQVEGLDTLKLKEYSCIEIENYQTILAGICVLPVIQTQHIIGFDTPNQFLNLITTTRAGSILKCLLAVKPKGFIVLEKNIISIILPLHRIDFLQAWINQISQRSVSLDWLSGSTGEIPEELAAAIGSIDQTQTSFLENWLEIANHVKPVAFEMQFKRALAGFQKN